MRPSSSKSAMCVVETTASTMLEFSEERIAGWLWPALKKCSAHSFSRLSNVSSLIGNW